MTGRYCGFVVTLENELRDDDAEATIAAIKQLRGVVSVAPVVANYEHHMAKAQARSELVGQLWDVLKGR